MILTRLRVSGANAVGAKLTDEKVLEIRSLAFTKSRQELQEIYGISKSHLCRIIKGDRWKHLNLTDLTADIRIRNTNWTRSQNLLAEVAPKITQATALEIREYCLFHTRKEAEVRFSVSLRLLNSILKGDHVSCQGLPDIRKQAKRCDGYARGSRVHSATLTEETVLEIKRLLKQGQRAVDIGKRFDISPQNVGKIKRGERWGWLEEQTS